MSRKVYVQGVRFIVMESCEDYEQCLALDTSKDLPEGGILTWREGGKSAAFGTRNQARDAINRTHHYAQAFGRTDLPEKRFCSIVAVNLIEEAGHAE